ncbi:DUF2147 domain-containing protein [Oceanicella actignis]|uniref:DUF2147 domain-containing protein n=1 Tax=Oceanicella actignis TaxID=1189325 RepID=UPI0011E7422D|nr:DUF2147 domain-containing protein [Oceanicella actignis]TYO91548.1 uncharacterized protein (DUF2147 family) [Oceanicella actignis]
MRWFASGAAAAMIAAAGVAGAVEQDPAFGEWLVESGSAIVRIAPCAGESACGAIVWLARPKDESGAPRTDAANPDPALRERPLCGMTFLSGFSREKPGVWTGGQIYNAEDGETYSARMEVRDDGKLHLRGYVGLPIFGKSQTWTRAEGDRGGCKG